MSAERVASRYAKSLLDIAIEQGKLETIKGDVDNFMEVASNRDFYLMLKSPVIKGDKKKSIFTAVFGDSLDPIVSSFLNILVSKGRENILPEIGDEFIKQYKNYNKIVTVFLTTATELSDDNLSAIESQIQSGLPEGTKIDLQTKVDNSLIGGFVIQMEDQLYDASVAYRLEQMKKQFSGNSYVGKM